MKAIQTRYKGYRFRSRLEARWAVFFDALGIKWEYEKEGYKLESGLYLPDFWLPQVSMWAEVKPGPLSKAEFMLCEQLARHTDFPVLMLSGIPDAKPYPAIRGAEYEHGGWLADIDYYDIQDENEYWKSEGRFYWIEGDCVDFGCDSNLPVPEASDELWQGLVFEGIKREAVYGNGFAIAAARAARFEFGESG